MEKLRQDTRINHIDGGLLHPLFLTDPVEFFYDIIAAGNFREMDQLQGTVVGGTAVGGTLYSGFFFGRCIRHFINNF